MDEPLAAGDWPQNYFNYFTETEEHFQRARGTGLFRLSPLDWALIEAWKNAGVPLEAVLRGIDTAFETLPEERRAEAKRVEALSADWFALAADTKVARWLSLGERVAFVRGETAYEVVPASK